MEENEVLEFDLNHNSKGEVSSSLKVSAVLSWIMAGLMILISGIMLLLKGTMEKFVEESPEQFNAEQLNVLELLLENYNSMFLSSFIFYLISVFAVILMYKLNRIGFYIYVPLHILILVFPYTYQPFIMGTGVIFNFAVLILFAALYGSNLKHMK